VKVSGCSFISNCFRGAFCMFESMATVLPYVDDYTVLDLGSSDGTLHYLERIADVNPKVTLLRGEFPQDKDAGNFAKLANDVIAMCPNKVVWYHQADEIWHEDLAPLILGNMTVEQSDMAFWRIQYRDNFQKVKWFPHIVHRVGEKGKFNFVGDGMNTDRYMEPPIISDYDGGYFTKWGEMGEGAIKPFISQMVLDVSLVGGFRDNIIDRRALHAPFWHEPPTIEGKPADQWRIEAEMDENWTKKKTPFDLPGIMRWHVGRTRYELREELFDALCANDLPYKGV